ncbi:MAG: CoA transferase [Gammaproteobacteria bacterium]|nr:CoA transferase [Gammaproteobacteria bacterium]
MTAATPQARPLDGVRVIEVGQLLAGPFAGTILGYYGAEVIKVEPPNDGDPIRTWRECKNGQGLWWSSLARNKKCVTLNLREAEGQKMMRELLAKSDVLIENFRPGTMEKWGLGPGDVKQFHPGLIYTRISGYGQTGPYAPRAGFASVCEAFGGFRYVNGFPGQPSVRPNLSIGDTLAGIHAALGILLAYINRGRDAAHRGQVVDVAIYEAVYNLLEGVVPEYSGAGVVREMSGSTLTGIVPSNIYPTADGKTIVIGANTNPMFQRLSELMGMPEMAADPRYKDNNTRVANQAELDAAIGRWTGSLPQQECLAKLDAAGVAAGPIYSVADMMVDPQYQARGMFETVEVNGEELAIPALCPVLADTPGRTDWPGAKLGAHTDDVYAELLGLDDAERAKLREAGII